MAVSWSQSRHAGCCGEAKEHDGFKAAIADPDVKAIVLICEGRTFIAGADISEFGGAQKGASLLDVQAMMEDSPKPVVAAIHGTALGGGL